MSPAQDKFYWSLWRSACAQQGWDQKDSGKRHAVHVQSLGGAKSHKDCSNADFDRVKALLEVLANPDSVAARIVLDSYEEVESEDPGERKRILFRIRQLFESPYIERVSFDKFKTRRWEDLPIGPLRHLCLTLSERCRERKRRAH